MSKPKSPYRIPLRAIMTRRDWFAIVGVSILGVIVVACSIIEVAL